MFGTPAHNIRPTEEQVCVRAPAAMPRSMLDNHVHPLLPLREGPVSDKGTGESRNPKAG